MRKLIIAIITIGIIIVFGYTGLFLYQKSQTPNIEYKIDEPFTTDIIKKTVASGAIEPREEIEIKPTVSGILDAIYVEPGDKVKAGDLIARVKIIPNMSSLNNAESRVRSAEIAFSNAKKELNRYKGLKDQNVVSEFDYSRYVLTFEQAEEELIAAKDNLEIIKEGATKKMGTASTNLVKATITGMVLDVPVKKGASVIESNNFNAGTTIASIAEMDDLIFIGKVDESEVGNISRGMQISLDIGAIKNKTFNATLEYISPKGVEEEGAIQFEIKAAVKLEEGFFIRAGYSANAEIILEKREGVLAINESVLKFDEQGNIFVEKEIGEGQFEVVSVDLGLSDGVKVEVISGVKKADRLKIQDAGANYKISARRKKSS